MILDFFFKVEEDDEFMGHIPSLPEFLAHFSRFFWAKKRGNTRREEEENRAKIVQLFHRRKKSAQMLLSLLLFVKTRFIISVSHFSGRLALNYCLRVFQDFPLFRK